MKKLVLILFLLCTSALSQTTPIKNIEPHQLTSITRQEVYWIYTLKTRFWYDGTKIIVYYMDFDSPIHVAFCRDVLGTSVYQFKNSIDTYVNVGVASYFRKVSSEQEMYEKVSKTNGAVGYLSETTLLINDGGRNVRKINIVN